MKAAPALTLALATGLALELGTGCSKKPRASEPVRVAAAADLSDAFGELGETFSREQGQRIEFVFGSSGLLAKQLREGAPFDLFAAANVAYVDEAIASGACDAQSKRRYARGHIVLYWRDGGVSPPPISLEDLADPRFKRIAIANPDHAPYGLAAREALSNAGVLERVKDRLVYAENVRQTRQLAETGNVEVAIIALSLVSGAKGGNHLAIDDARHGPIEQSLVVCTNGKNVSGGKSFAEFVASPAAQRVLERHGLGSPNVGD